MKKNRLTVVAMVIVASATACSNATAPDQVHSSGAVRKNGGTLGTGHVAPGEGGTVGSGYGATPDATSDATIVQDTTGRGGTLGTGH